MPISSHILRKYRQYGDVFIETGTLNGQTVRNALAVGFPKVYSIELSEELHAAAQKKFASDKRVHLIYGDSGEKLSELIETIDEPCVFWLDAHYSAGNTAGKGMQPPLIHELKAIACHPIKTHTILIDDVRIFPNRMERADVHTYRDMVAGDDLAWDNIMACVARTNIEYKTKFENGHVKNDIFVAYV